MEIIEKNNGVLEINNARIIYRNFSGTASKFNREGDRNFAVIIPDEDICNQLVDAGWSVKIKDPRDDYEEPFRYLPVKVKFNNRGPGAYLVSGDATTRLTEDTIGIIDDIDIACVNMDIRPYDWEVNGKTGRSAYLQAIEVIQNSDRFGAKYSAENE